MRTNKIFLILSIFFLITSSSIGQSVVLQVVTKKVNKKFVYQTGDKLIINSSKAEVEISTWDKNLIQLEFLVISKHPDKSIAKEDLQKMEFEFVKNLHLIVLDNAIDKSDGMPTSNLKAKYKLTIPENCPVDLTNYFGKNRIENLKNGLDLKSEFCEVGIKHLKGLINVQSKFGDITGEDIEGKVFIDANRSNITLSKIAGDFDINANYGVVKIFADQTIVNMNIRGKKSDVYFYNSGQYSFNYDLTAHHGSISVEDKNGFDFMDNGPLHKALFIPSKEIVGMKVVINVSFSNIRILK